MQSKDSFTTNHSYNKFTSQGPTGKCPYETEYKVNKYYFSEPSQESKLVDGYPLDFDESKKSKSTDYLMLTSLDWCCVLLEVLAFLPNKCEELIVLKQLKDS